MKKLHRAVQETSTLGKARSTAMQRLWSLLITFKVPFPIHLIQNPRKSSPLRIPGVSASATSGLLLFLRITDLLLLQPPMKTWWKVCGIFEKGIRRIRIKYLYIVRLQCFSPRTSDLPPEDPW